MSLGGGSFTTQNKVLPGAYINFISAASASAELSQRGIATMPLELDWGMEGEVFEVTGEMYRKECQKIFGYNMDHESMKGINDVFLGARTLYAYRLNGGGTKASNVFAVAAYSGKRGNDIKTVVQANADNEDMFDVITYLGATKVDSQTVRDAKGLVDNGYVKFKEGITLEAVSSEPMTGGTNGTVDGSQHQKYLDKIESYTYNTMGVAVTDDVTKKMYAAFNRRMRDEAGIRSQLVLYNMPADYMGVINVKNHVTDEGATEASLVYWVTGAESGCEVNKSVQNKVYDGYFDIDTDYTQADLQNAIRAGEFVLHNVNGEVRVLSDINSLVTTTETCGDVFRDNQTVRVIDQIGNDDAVLFNEKYLGKVPNNASGRISLWSDLVKIRQQLQDLGAIENFSDSDVSIEQGTTKKSVVVTSGITVVNAMDKLYMTVTVA